MKKNLLVFIGIITTFQPHIFSQQFAPPAYSMGTRLTDRCIDSTFAIATSVISTLIATYIIKQSLLSPFITTPQKEEIEPIITYNTFKDVAGADDIIEDLQEVVDFLKNPNFYQRLGARIPHGVLLSGPPGNGKTLLARAVAGEAQCSFIYATGSEFIELYVGVGASRIREIFAKARENAPCIIFIDEIDAIGAKRTKNADSGGKEYAQTLNQLLSEMDGFVQDEAPIIVLAATNRPDVLDKALLRPGRFDRKIHVPLPDLKGREDILNLHAGKIIIDPSVSIYNIACGTPGFSAAELENLINEATLIATKKEHIHVTIDDFEEARDRIMLGKERKTIQLTDEEKRTTAFHEAGHAIIRLMLPAVTDPLYKVTIIPRGGALGVAYSLPDREKHGATKEEMLATIQVCLGGRIAEELIFGEIATGASSDFQKATDIAHRMVCNYGMSDLGTVVYEDPRYYSEEAAKNIDREVKKIVDECYLKAKGILDNNRGKLYKLANALLEHGTLYADEIYTLLNIPARKNHRLN